MLIFYLIILCLGAKYVEALPTLEQRANVTLAACQQISSAISAASSVFYPPAPEYLSAVNHYSPTNTAASVCVVYPGTADDVASIIKIVGNSRVPFGVKGGGHCMNSLCSSTTGVLVAMARFNQVVLDKSSGTVQIGAGLIWDDVYSALEGTGATVLGGRVSGAQFQLTLSPFFLATKLPAGVGVAGFTLGAGYSWRTNQYGLTIDSVQQYELVTPQGTVTNITSANTDIFFALKGGFNNLGIVTRFWLASYPAPAQVWGGVRYYGGDQYDAVFGACSQFDLYNTDPKAAILCDYLLTGPALTLLVIAFYDGPTPPNGPFNNLSAIPPLSGTWNTRSMVDLVKSAPVQLVAEQRAWYHSASVRHITPAIVSSIKAIGNKYMTQALLNSGIAININPEPFVAGFFSHSQGGGYPHSSQDELRPIEINVVWTNPLNDAYFMGLAKSISADLLAAAAADGQNVSPSNEIIYPNYALADTPLATMYGSNVPRLQAITASWDPQKATSCRLRSHFTNDDFLGHDAGGRFQVSVRRYETYEATLALQFESKPAAEKPEASTCRGLRKKPRESRILKFTLAIKLS